MGREVEDDEQNCSIAWAIVVENVLIQKANYNETKVINIMSLILNKVGKPFRSFPGKTTLVFYVRKLFKTDYQFIAAVLQK